VKELIFGALSVLASSLVARLLVGAGMTLVSAVWIGGAVETALQYVSDAWGGMPGAVVQLLALGGVGQALSIVGAALVGRAALVAAQTFVKVASA